VSTGPSAQDPTDGSAGEARLSPPAGGPGSDAGAYAERPARAPVGSAPSATGATAVRDQSSAPDAQRVGTTITEISERATLLIHEEIELAKAEVTEKATALARGAAVGVAAGIFIATAIFFVLIGCAWLLYYYLPIGTAFTYFIGFFAMALILLILGVVAGLVAARVLKRSSPPTPDMAIEEARRIRETVAPGGDAGGASGDAVAPSGDGVGREVS
jgi:Putative Actinobacterial Holin-X, holin superfamily III